jgi:uncharacterized protein (DUF983 family)
MSTFGLNLTPSDSQCRFCHQGIGGTYFRVNTGMACPSCVERARNAREQDAPAAFVRAVTAGIGAAFVGLIGYALIAILLRGWVISIMAIAVGYLVATAMMKASKGQGGRRFQVAAVLLTYAAVSMAAVPIWMYFSGPQSTQQTERQKLQAEQRELERESGQQPSTSTEAPRSRMSLAGWLGRATLLGLISPFLALSGNPLWGGIGLLILFYGMRMAWQIAAGYPFEVYGPFENVPQVAR